MANQEVQDHGAAYVATELRSAVSDIITQTRSTVGEVKQHLYPEGKSAYELIRSALGNGTSVLGNIGRSLLARALSIVSGIGGFIATRMINNNVPPEQTVNAPDIRGIIGGGIAAAFRRPAAA